MQSRRDQVQAYFYVVGRLVSALEGGYDLGALADSAAAHVRALMR